MSLYIIDKHGSESALPYVRIDESAKIFLVQDGLFLSADLFQGKEVFVLAEEVTERGLDEILPKSFQIVSPEQMVDFILEEQVISFC